MGIPSKYPAITSSEKIISLTGLKAKQMKDEKPQMPDKKIVRSEDLFGNDREIIIEHRDSRYRLQITKAGKLILNK